MRATALPWPFSLNIWQYRSAKKDVQMRLAQFVAKNFRALEDVEVEFDNRVNVIVGPNAIGKTTVLEAIRFSKALLAPRTQNESQQTIMALGAGVPYNGQMFFPEAIA